MKMAKASADDLRQVNEFLQMIEEFVEYGTYTAGEDDEPEPIDDSQFIELIRDKWGIYRPGVSHSWFRVVFGCQILIDNCCDPDADTLEFRPDIAKAMEAAGVSDD